MMLNSGKKDALLADIVALIEKIIGLGEPVGREVTGEEAERLKSDLREAIAQLDRLAHVSEVEPLQDLSELLLKMEPGDPGMGLVEPRALDKLKTVAGMVSSAGSEEELKGSGPLRTAVTEMVMMVSQEGESLKGPDGTGGRGGEGKEGKASFLQMFREELEELIDRFGTGVLNIETSVHEGRGDLQGIIEEVMRAAHSLKGSAKMVGAPEIGEIAHRIEDILKDIAGSETVPSPELIDILLSASDTMRGILRGLLGGGGPETSPKELLEKLDDYRGRKEEIVGPGPGVESDRGDSGKPTERTSGRRVKPEVKPMPDLFSDTIRVGVDKLDRLINIVGELLVTEISLERRLKDLHYIIQEMGSLGMRSEVAPAVNGRGVFVAPRMEGVIGGAKARFRLARESLASFYRALSDNLARLDHFTQDLKITSLEMRMLPASLLFKEFKRAARDIARQMGKSVKVVTEGEDTYIDKRLMEELRSPIVHMIRNSLDHGIESPEERKAKGKPKTGTIILRAYRKGAEILVEIEDDGAGIDPDAVRERALKQGIISEQQAGSMNGTEIRYLIFRPGFSTSERVTSVSGRGVGMDVVKASVDRLRGQIVIQSEPGRYTRFVLSFPLNLSTFPVLFVLVSGQVFAVPLNYVQMVGRIGREQVFSEAGHQLVNLDGEIFPLFHLGQLLGFKGCRIPERKKFPVVLLRFQEAGLVLVVDKCLGDQEIMVKPLGRHLGSIRNIAGATILDNGEPALVLEIPDLFEVIQPEESMDAGPSRS